MNISFHSWTSFQMYISNIFVFYKENLIACLKILYEYHFIFSYMCRLTTMHNSKSDIHIMKKILTWWKIECVFASIGLIHNSITYPLALHISLVLNFCFSTHSWKKSKIFYLTDISRKNRFRFIFFPKYWLNKDSTVKFVTVTLLIHGTCRIITQNSNSTETNVEFWNIPNKSIQSSFSCCSLVVPSTLKIRMASSSWFSTKSWHYKDYIHVFFCKWNDLYH